MTSAILFNPCCFGFHYFVFFFFQISVYDPDQYYNSSHQPQTSLMMDNKLKSLYNFITYFN